MVSVQQPNNLLALDQASVTSGYAIFKNQNLVEWGKFTFNDDNIGERLVKIRNKVNELIEEFEITEVAFEDIQLQASTNNNVQTFKVLAEVYGVILELVHSKNIKYSIISSNTWKSTLKIKGRARAEQKQSAQQFVLEKYNIKAVQDTCDAICIGTHVINELGHDWSN